MLGYCILTGLGISLTSTMIYALSKSKRDRINEWGVESEVIEGGHDEHLKMFSITFIISIFFLFITNTNQSGEIIQMKTGFLPKVNNQPPF